MNGRMDHDRRDLSAGAAPLPDWTRFVPVALVAAGALLIALLIHEPADEGVWFWSSESSSPSESWWSSDTPSEPSSWWSSEPSSDTPSEPGSWWPFEPSSDGDQSSTSSQTGADDESDR